MKNKLKLESEFNLTNDFPPQTFEQWKTRAEKDLKSKKIEDISTSTYEGINLKPIYSAADLSQTTRSNEMPGFTDFRRGYLPEGFVIKGWSIAQALPPLSINELNKILLKGINFNLNTFLINVKSSESQKGIQIDNVEIIEKLFKNVDLSRTTIYFNTGFSPLSFILILKAFLNKRGISISNFRGGVVADPLGFILSNGSLPTSLNNAYKELAISIKYFKNLNNPIKIINISTLPIAEAGGNIVQELAYSIAAGVHYLNELISLNIPPEIVSKFIKFTFTVGSFQFLEIAKFRAARILWHNILKEYKVEPRMFIHAKNVEYNKSALDPYVNIIRTTAEAFSAIIAGVNLFESIPFDFLSNNFSELGFRLANNLQLILKEESQIHKFIDAGGGSYYIENLTEKFAKKAWALFQKIQKEGGIVQAIQNGSLQKSVIDVSRKRSDNFATGKEILVGANMFAKTDENYSPISTKSKEKTHFKEHSTIEQNLINRFNNLLEEKFNIFDSVEKELIEKLTLDTINNALHRNTIQYSVNPLKPVRSAEPFEKVRALSNKFKSLNKRKPSVLLLALGLIDDYKIISDFVRNIFEVGGFKVIISTINTTLQNIQSNTYEAVVFCKNSWDVQDFESAAKVYPVTKNKQIFLATIQKTNFKIPANLSDAKIIYKGINYLELLNILYDNILQK